MGLGADTPSPNMGLVRRDHILAQHGIEREHVVAQLGIECGRSLARRGFGRGYVMAHFRVGRKKKHNPILDYDFHVMVFK